MPVSVALLALVGCDGSPPTEPVSTLPIDTLYVDCFDGYDVKWLSPSETPGLAIARLGSTTESLAGAFVRDKRTWDRGPVEFLDAPLPVDDHMLVYGTVPGFLPEGWWLVSPDGETEPVDFSADTSGRLPLGSVSYASDGGMHVALTLEGWARYSHDGGATWSSNLHSFTEGLGVARDDRSLVVAPSPSGGPVVLYSSDGGFDYTTLPSPVQLSDPELFGSAGIALIDTPASEIAVSPDHGATWTRHGPVGNFMMPGIGDAELWVLGESGGDAAQSGLLRTTDGGATWRAVALVAGDETLAVNRPWSTYRDEDGAQVLVLGVLDETGVDAGSRVCTIVEAPGAMDLTRTPSRDDTPGSITFWVGSGIPMPEPGQTSTLAPVFRPEQWGFVDVVLDVERTAEGNIQLLLAPETLGVNSPYEVWEFTGTDGSEVFRRTRWDNLRDGNTPLILETFDFQSLPDGTLRAQALDGSGNYPFGGTDAPPRWGYAGIWGPTPEGPEYLATGAPFGWGGVFERVGVADGTRCDIETPTETCVLWRTGDPWVDYILYDDWIYNIDGRHGRVLRHAKDGTVGDWEVVIEGLINPTQLAFTWDLGDPGLYVQDEGWWRFVPGDVPLRRP